ncbi:mirror-image polydactyly gene 1 protein isoform X2 [Tachyglossus aculeatus]|uniref:mirror-image polydactyly gene 1 protein isoform X2 n=1 Tax=Tachyglossus aculeatus TaxID=9261 RepID=UPI0018F28CE5|nr:mirror-image polydactyly gene 1 protein isoform X2 [Tachyglossus aculeatus]
MSSKILERELGAMPDQTSSGRRLEDWLKGPPRCHPKVEIPQEEQNPHLPEHGKPLQPRDEPVGPAECENESLWVPSPKSLPPVGVERAPLGDVEDYGAPEGPRGRTYGGSSWVYDFMGPSQVTADRDKEKTVALLKEMDILRASNKKLRDQLEEKDAELKTVQLELELLEQATEAKIAEKTAALVEEVYFAQREREEAVMARLRLANEERDEAVSHAKQLEMSLKQLENINPEENDMTLQELLNRINNAGTGIAIQKNGAIIVDQIYKTKELQKKITTEELNAVTEERDAALSQCKRLERELHHLKEQNQTSANNMRHLTAENNQERALKAKLSTMERAREMAIQQYQKLEEELQTLRVYYRLERLVDVLRKKIGAGTVRTVI